MNRGGGVRWIVHFVIGGEIRASVRGQPLKGEPRAGPKLDHLFVEPLRSQCSDSFVYRHVKPDVSPSRCADMTMQHSCESSFKRARVCARVTLQSKKWIALHALTPSKESQWSVAMEKQLTRSARSVMKSAATPVDWRLSILFIVRVSEVGDVGGRSGWTIVIALARRWVLFG